MENATKALEMAGSVLIGVLIIGCIVYAYSQLSAIKRDEQTSERVEQAADFNKDYDAYNRDDLYGSDMFSLANMIENYNIKESDTKYYGKIEIKLKLNTQVINATFFTDSSYNESTLNEKYRDLTNAIKDVNKKYFKKTVSYWANFGTSTRLENQLRQELR